MSTRQLPPDEASLLNDGRLRVCVVRHGYFPADPRVRKEVSALLEKSHEVTVLCLRGSGEQPREVWRGARVYRMPLSHRRQRLAGYLAEYGMFFLLAFATLTWLGFPKRFDVVQVNTMPDFLVFASWVLRLCGTRIVIDLHELMPELFAAQYRLKESSIAIRIVKLIERLAIAYSHQAIAVSPLQVSIFQRRMGASFVVVPNVPEEGLFPTQGSDGYGVSKVPLLVTHGTLLERYGVQVIIRALPRILESMPAMLHVIGDGEYRGELQREVTRLGLDDHVAFVGHVPIEEVWRQIRPALLGIVPLLQDGYMELASPNKLFEYVALGKAVVASDLPGVRAYFDDTQIAFVRAGDHDDLACKVVSLYREPRLREQFALRAMETYKQVEWSNSKELYVKTLTRAARGGAVPESRSDEP